MYWNDVHLKVFGDLRHMQRYSVIYVTSHICAGGLKKLYLRSASQRHRHFVGFFNVPVLHRHGANLFIRLFRETALFLPLRHAGDTKDAFLSKPTLAENIIILQNSSSPSFIIHLLFVCILSYAYIMLLNP